MPVLTRTGARALTEEIAVTLSSLRLERPSPLDLRERLAGIILPADSLLQAIPTAGATGQEGRDHLLPIAQGLRDAAYLLMTYINPEQAWFWTEDWQAREREADAAIANGHTTVYHSDEDFLAALRAERTDLADL